MQLHTAGLLFIKNKKLLLAFSKNKQCFYLPGGKVDENETASQALCREIEEELHVSLTDDDLEYYTHITAKAFGEDTGVVMEQDCFFVRKQINPLPGAEIETIRFFTLAEYLEQDTQAPGAVLILEQLTAAGLLQ